MSITRQQYWDQIQDLWDDALDEEADQASSEDDLRERVQERIWEAVDGHQWIIYYAQNLDVLKHTDNDDAYFEEYGPLEAKSATDAFQKMAFAAMYRDVMDKWSEDAIEEAWEARDED